MKLSEAGVFLNGSMLYKKQPTIKPSMFPPRSLCEGLGPIFINQSSYGGEYEFPRGNKDDNRLTRIVELAGQ
jgi:hypothetical protein